MFATRDLSPPVAAWQTEVLPDARVVDCGREFDVLPADLTYELALFTDAVTPVTYPDTWIPGDAPSHLQRYTGSNPVVGRPGQGSVTWTRQYDPPVVIVKPRGRDLPESFLAFVLAEALLVCSLGLPEHPLGFFEGNYQELQDIVGEPAPTARLAGALFDAWIGLHTRPRYRGWANDHPELLAAWEEAGRLLDDRIANLQDRRTSGSIDFLEATDIACSAIKHGHDLPSPYQALAVDRYRTEGAPYALRWVERTINAVAD